MRNGGNDNFDNFVEPGMPYDVLSATLKKSY